MTLKPIVAGAILASALALAAWPAAGQELSELAQPPNGMNQKAEISQWIGLVKVTITYHSPNVHGPAGRDRTGHIWGELVKYGMFDDGFGPSKEAPWRAGANETTTISVSHDVKIGGMDLRAGTYGLFLEIQPSGPWTWSSRRRRGGAPISTIRNSMCCAYLQCPKRRPTPSS